MKIKCQRAELRNENEILSIMNKLQNHFENSTVVTAVTAVTAVAAVTAGLNTE